MMNQLISSRRRLLLAFALIVLTVLACGLPSLVAPETADPAVEAEAAQVETAGDDAGSAGQEGAPAGDAPEDQPVSSESVSPPAEGDTYLATGESLAALYESAIRGVVSVRIQADTGGGQGSGFVLDDQGHIVTNYHVIEGATAIEVGFWNGFKTRATVIGSDLDSDLSVLKVDVPAEQLHPLPLGDSDAIRVGEVAVVLGNPFGLGSSMTVGIISAKGRVLTSLNITEDGRPFSAGDLIQTDAAINPGNSGGPLLNILGEVIGINRAIRTESFTDEGSPVNSGIGFAISVNILKRVAPSLIATGSVDYPFLGVSSLPELSIFDQEELGLPQSTGALVIALTPEGPAEVAGIQVGDLITHIDEREVIVFGDLLGYLVTQKSPGDDVVLTVLRGGELIEITVTLGSR